MRDVAACRGPGFDVSDGDWREHKDQVYYISN
jgi:hypothetical protein